MALTVTSRGTGTHNTGATTLVPGGRTATLAAGSLGVLCIALDNQGSGGAATAAPASWTDAKGNVWTRRINALYDNGAASAGIEMVFYTAPITVALLTGDLGTITWDGGVSPVAKAWTWYEVIPSVGSAVYSTGGSIAGATAANAQVVSATVPAGDAVIAGYFSENVAAVTGDSDSTNGTWAAQQTATVGSTTSGVRVATQQKVQTTTPSTQSYDVTVSSQDRIAGYILLHESNPITASPSVGALTLTPVVPTVSKTNHQRVVAGVLALTLATFAPTVAAPRVLSPALKATAVTTFAPSVLTPRVASPPLKALTLSTFAPTVSAPRIVSPAVTALALTPLVATVTASDHKTVSPGLSALTSATFAPTVAVTDHQVPAPSVAAVALTTSTPSVAVTEHRVAAPVLATLALTASAPTVAVSDNQAVTPAPGSLTATGLVPTVDVTARVVVAPAPVVLTIETFSPGVSASAAGTYATSPAQLVLETFAPSVGVTAGVVASPSVAELALVGQTPTVHTGGSVAVAPVPAALVLAGVAPTVSSGGEVGQVWRLVIDGGEVPAVLRLAT